MPDYGVDASSWVPLPWAWALERLATNRNFWVVTVSPEGQPNASPVWGVWDNNSNRFAFSCGPRSRKVRNLAANARVTIMTEDTVECLSLEGRARRDSAGRATAGRATARRDSDRRRTTPERRCSVARVAGASEDRLGGEPFPPWSGRSLGQFRQAGRWCLSTGQ